MATPGVIANFYDSSSEQSILSRAIALVKYGYNNTITSYDTKGLNSASMDSLISGISAGTLTRVVLSNGTQATYSTAGKFINTQVATLDSLLKTANKGTSVRAGTCQANSTVTEIVLDSGASAVDDTYNGMYIKTAGTTAVYRRITDYVGSTKTCTVVTTTTAITTTETFVVYTQGYVDIVGDASSNENACLVAWNTLFPTVDAPMIIKVMGGYGSAFAAYVMNAITADSVATASGVSTLTKSAYFGSTDLYKGRWVGIISGTTGGGEVHQIASNTTSVLTLSTPFRILPTGTIVFQISETKEYALANYALVYAIKTYLQLDNGVTNKILKAMLDKYNILQYGKATTLTAVGDDELVKTYVQRGKVVMDYSSL